MMNLNGLKRSLANKLWLGCANSTQVIKDNTPIDTQRLFESVDSTNVVETQENVFKCRIVVGGKNLYGVRREKDVKKPVSYALQVEARHGFVRKSLSEISYTIVREFE